MVATGQNRLEGVGPALTRWWWQLKAWAEDTAVDNAYLKQLSKKIISHRHFFDFLGLPSVKKQKFTITWVLLLIFSEEKCSVRGEGPFIPWGIPPESDVLVTALGRCPPTRSVSLGGEAPAERPAERGRPNCSGPSLYLPSRRLYPQDSCPKAVVFGAGSRFERSPGRPHSSASPPLPGTSPFIGGAARGRQSGVAPPRKAAGGAARRGRKWRGAGPGRAHALGPLAAVMAERIEQRLEDRVPELEQLERVGLFTRKEIRWGGRETAAAGPGARRGAGSAGGAAGLGPLADFPFPQGRPEEGLGSGVQNTAESASEGGFY